MKERHNTKRERKLTTPPPTTLLLSKVNPKEKTKDIAYSFVPPSTSGSDASKEPPRVLLRSTRSSINDDGKSAFAPPLQEMKSERRHPLGTVLLSDDLESVGSEGTGPRAMKTPTVSSSLKASSKTSLKMEETPSDSRWVGRSTSRDASHTLAQDEGRMNSSSNLEAWKSNGHSARKYLSHSISTPSRSSDSNPFRSPREQIHQKEETNDERNAKGRAERRLPLPCGDIPVALEYNSSSDCDINAEGQFSKSSEDELKEKEDQLLQRGDALSGPALQNFLDGVFLEGLGEVDTLLSNWKP